jgi:Polyketide cyclase / dehydrase and lipid transport
MLKKIAYSFMALVGVLLLYAATKPDTFHVQRSISIQAPPEKIFPILNDFHQSASWSPYEKKDPAMKRAFSGPESGKGAIYQFDGNKEVGKGQLTITDTTPSSKVVLALDMLEPFEAHNIVEYSLAAKSGSTDVTWAIHGQQPYIGKVMSLFIDCDKMIGQDFEVGLANLKALSETNLKASTT